MMMSGHRTIPAAPHVAHSAAMGHLPIPLFCHWVLYSASNPTHTSLKRQKRYCRVICDGCHDDLHEFELHRLPDQVGLCESHSWLALIYFLRQAQAPSSGVVFNKKPDPTHEREARPRGNSHIPFTLKTARKQDFYNCHHTLVALIRFSCLPYGSRFVMIPRNDGARTVSRIFDVS